MQVHPQAYGWYPSQGYVLPQTLPRNATVMFKPGWSPFVSSDAQRSFPSPEAAAAAALAAAAGGYTGYNTVPVRSSAAHWPCPPPATMPGTAGYGPAGGQYGPRPAPPAYRGQAPPAPNVTVTAAGVQYQPQPQPAVRMSAPMPRLLYQGVSAAVRPPALVNASGAGVQYQAVPTSAPAPRPLSNADRQLQMVLQLKQKHQEQKRREQQLQQLGQDKMREEQQLLHQQQQQQQQQQQPPQQQQQPQQVMQTAQWLRQQQAVQQQHQQQEALQQQQGTLQHQQQQQQQAFQQQQALQQQQVLQQQQAMPSVMMQRQPQPRTYARQPRQVPMASPPIQMQQQQLPQQPQPSPPLAPPQQQQLQSQPQPLKAKKQPRRTKAAAAAGGAKRAAHSPAKRPAKRAAIDFDDDEPCGPVCATCLRDFPNQPALRLHERSCQQQLQRRAGVTVKPAPLPPLPPPPRLDATRPSRPPGQSLTREFACAWCQARFHLELELAAHARRCRPQPPPQQQPQQHGPPVREAISPSALVSTTASDETGRMPPSSPLVRRSVPAATPARRNTPASSPTRRNTPASSPARRNTAASSAARRNIPASSPARGNIPASSPARGNTPASARRKGPASAVSGPPASAVSAASRRVPRASGAPQGRGDRAAPSSLDDARGAAAAEPRFSGDCANSGPELDPSDADDPPEDSLAPLDPLADPLSLGADGPGAPLSSQDASVGHVSDPAGAPAGEPARPRRSGREQYYGVVNRFYQEEVTETTAGRKPGPHSRRPADGGGNKSAGSGRSAPPGGGGGGGDGQGGSDPDDGWPPVPAHVLAVLRRPALVSLEPLDDMIGDPRDPLVATAAYIVHGDDVVGRRLRPARPQSPPDPPATPAQVAADHARLRQGSGSPDDPLVVSSEDEEDGEPGSRRSVAAGAVRDAEGPVMPAESGGRRQRLVASGAEESAASGEERGDVTEARGGARRRRRREACSASVQRDSSGEDFAVPPRARRRRVSVPSDSESDTPARPPSSRRRRRRRSEEDAVLAVLQHELNPPRRSRARVSYAETGGSDGEATRESPASPEFRPDSLDEAADDPASEVEMGELRLNEDSDASDGAAAAEAPEPRSAERDAAAAAEHQSWLQPRVVLPRTQLQRVDGLDVAAILGAAPPPSSVGRPFRSDELVGVPAGPEPTADDWDAVMSQWAELARRHRGALSEVKRRAHQVRYMRQRLREALLVRGLLPPVPAEAAEEGAGGTVSGGVQAAQTGDGEVAAADMAEVSPEGQVTAADAGKADVAASGVAETGAPAAAGESVNGRPERVVSEETTLTVAEGSDPVMKSQAGSVMSEEPGVAVAEEADPVREGQVETVPVGGGETAAAWEAAAAGRGKVLPEDQDKTASAPAGHGEKPGTQAVSVVTPVEETVKAAGEGGSVTPRGVLSEGGIDQS